MSISNSMCTRQCKVPEKLRQIVLIKNFGDPVGLSCELFVKFFKTFKIQEFIFENDHTRIFSLVVCNHYITL